MPNISTVDRRILDVLQSDARRTNKSLAAEIGLAPSTTLDRVRDLERRGVIAGYHAEVDLRALGRGLQAMIAVRIEPKTEANVERLVSRLESLPETLAVFMMSGVDDVLVHVSVPDTDSLRHLVLTEIANQEGVVDERTSLVFEHRRRTVVSVIEPR